MNTPVKSFVTATTLAIVALLGVSMWWHNTWLLIPFLILCGTLLWLLRRSREDIYLYFFVAVIGPLFEMIGIAGGAWQYAEPSLFTVPLWLPFLWGAAALYVRNFLALIERRAPSKFLKQ